MRILVLWKKVNLKSKKMRIIGFWKREKFWPKKWKKTKNAERLKIAGEMVEREQKIIQKK